MKRFLAEFVESLRIAAEQVRQHKMRAGLTALGVIIGVLAVSLMGTAVKGIDRGFNESLEMVGLDVFYVSRWPWRDVGDDWRTYAARPVFNMRHVDRMNELIRETGSRNLELTVPESSKYKTVRHERNLVEGTEIIGTSADYMRATAFKLATGRFFTEAEAAGGQHVALLGAEVSEALFPEGLPLGRRVVVDNVPFVVIGTLEKQGEFLGLMSMDRRIVVPELASRKLSWWDQDLSLLIKKRSEASKGAAYDEIEDLARRVRGLMPEQPNDFEINRTEVLEEQLGPIKNGVAVAGLFITGLSLAVGAIGIMNITFVSVRERTKEIGTRRALGASRRAILIQFLMEAVSICVLGGVVGLLLTFAVQAAVRQAMPAFPMVFSADLIVIGMAVSIAVGVLSGIVPAWLASRLDPATALRHD